MCGLSIEINTFELWLAGLSGLVVWCGLVCFRETVAKITHRVTRNHHFIKYYSKNKASGLPSTRARSWPNTTANLAKIWPNRTLKLTLLHLNYVTNLITVVRCLQMVWGLPILLSFSNFIFKE